ncbi:MAG TPA: CbtB-domain containing protein [Allocoleopsis sp.]
MKTSSIGTLGSLQQRTVRFTLSLPVQATLYTSLCALILWTVYFSTYPAVHNQMHSLRHHTLLVGCH